MNTQKRSKILAIGVAGALLAGASLPLLPFAIARAEAQSSSSTTLLDRGTQLISQHEYQTAKQVLLSIDPSKLSGADQTRLASLLQKADAGIAGMSMDLTVYHNATASLQDGHYAHAAKLFHYLIKSPDVSPELKSEAADNLALTQAKQQQLVPQMKSLLQDATHAYQAGNFDQAEADLNKIQVSGVDLGDQANLIPHYQYLIAQRRVEQVRQLEAAQQAKTAAVQTAAPQASAAEKKLLAEQNQQEAQRAAATQAALAMKNRQAEKAAAAAKLAQEQHQQQLAQAAAAEKLVQQQKAAQQKLMEQEAAAKKLAQEQKAQQAQAAAAAKMAQQQKMAEIKMQAQRAAAEKLAAAKLAQQQQLAQQQLLAQQQTQEQQAEQARQAAAALAAQQAAATGAKTEAPQQAATEAQQPQPVQSATTKVQPTETPAPVATPAPAPVMVMSSSTAPKATPAVTSKAPATTMQSASAQEISKPSLAEIERERSAALVVRADDDLRNADYQHAVALYNDALALDPKNQAAAMGLRNAQKLALGQSPGLLSQQIYDQAIQAQRAHVLFDNDLQLSAKEMQAGKYPQAVDHVNDGLATIEAARGILTAGDYKEMKARADQQLAVIQQQEAQAQAIAQANRAKEVTQSQMQIEHQLAVRRQMQINQLMGQAREYFKQMQYQQALDTLNQVIAIDPQNNTALFMQEMVSDQIQYNAWNHYHHLRSEAEQAQEVKGQEYMIPYPNLEIYPQDWPELSRMREAEQHNSESPADKEARLALARNVSKIVVNQQPFSDVVRLLRQQTGANIVVNWNALSNAGVQKNTPISLTLRGVPFKKVLSLVLQQAQGSGGTQLGYSISGGVLTISTNDQLAQQKTTRVFDIQDLLVQAPNFTAPTFNLQNQSSTSGVQVSSGSSGGGGGAGSSDLFSGSGGGQGGQQQAGKTRAQMVTEITQLIENTVARNSWIDNGGTVGSVREINGQLVITQTPGNLEKVSGLLKQLRETRSVEISIDARFLYVTTGFLNDFGFSWSLGFGNMFGSDVGQVAGAGTSTPSISGPVSITNNSSTYATPQTTGVTNSIGGTYSTPSLSLAGGILSNYQLNLLLNATEINKRNTLLEAPRITLFNGQRATMVVEDVQNYVQSFTQTAGTGGLVGGVGGVATNLDVLPLTTGLSLSVQATVSSDDRYVIMTIQPSLSQLLSLQTFNINGQNTATAGASATALPGFVQLPQTQVTEVSTTVSVPDGGTLLLGGERLAGETTIEAGVPVLSQIPIINRLFTNSSTTKDNLVLLILVRPRIIIQKEFEKKQFGRNY